MSTPARLDPTSPEFSRGFWLYDTPGTVCEDQLINLLTQEEVDKVTPDLPLLPRSLTLRLGCTLFLGGLARLDLVKGPFWQHPLLVTVFCSGQTWHAGFYKTNYRSGVLNEPVATEKSRGRSVKQILAFIVFFQFQTNCYDVECSTVCCVLASYQARAPYVH